MISTMTIDKPVDQSNGDLFIDGDRVAPSDRR